MQLNLNEKSRATFEMILQKGRDSWPGDEGERRADRLEAVLRRVLPEYANALDLSQDAVLAALEGRRDYSAINFYQDARLPSLRDVHVHETMAEFKALIPSGTFRCPACEGVSTDPYECNSGVERDGSVCNWKAFGLFGTLGKGYRTLVKETFLDHPTVHEIFMPIDLEEDEPSKEGEPA
ncbi:hypothetical protein [Tritonibacter mobilis]|uniref:hypothetical protein n=1 Tax=Tritonibacter mobilis TaxID=379347 RepID=UPI0013B36F97|nr:hypothetical protein [Tritonibacter mobilis]